MLLFFSVLLQRFDYFEPITFESILFKTQKETKIMTKNVIFFIGTLFLFMSCHKETIDDDTEIVIEDPTEIDGLYFKGIVTSEEILIANATIDIYQDNKLLGMVNTDSNGEFDTKGITIAKDKEVTLYTQKKDHIPQGRRFTLTSLKANFNLVNSATTFVKSQNLPNPASDSLVEISGYIYTPTGEAVENIFVGMVYNENADGNTADGGAVYTDIDGRYSLLMPKNQEIHFFAIQENNCTVKILTAQEIQIGGLLPSQNIGSFTSNTILPPLNNASLPVPSVEINVFYTGTATDCFNFGVFSGNFTGTISVGSKTNYINAPVLLGEILYGGTGFCLQGNDINQPAILKGVVFDELSGITSDSINIISSSYNIELGNISVCDTETDEPSTMSLQIDNTFLYLPISIENYNINAMVENNSLAVPLMSSNDNGYLTFKIPNVSQDVTVLTDFSYNGVNHIVQQNQVINCMITEREANKVKGTISGNVINITHNNAVEPITGSFVIRY